MNNSLACGAGCGKIRLVRGLCRTCYGKAIRNPTGEEAKYLLPAITKEQKNEIHYSRFCKRRQSRDK
jgi:hypothetical protein